MRPDLRGELEPTLTSGGRRGGPADGGKPTLSPKERADRGRLWIKDGDFVRPLEVQIGISDGTNTEVSGDGVEEGLEVVLGENRTETADEDTTNPFAPKIFHGRPKSSSPLKKGDWLRDDMRKPRERTVPRGACPPVINGALNGTNTPMELIRLEDIHKTYHLGEVDVPVLKGISLTIQPRRDGRVDGRFGLRQDHA